MRLAFGRLYRLWKKTEPRRNIAPAGENRLVIIPCDPWTVGGSRGDEAMIFAVIQRYRKEHPSAPVTIVSAGEEGSNYVNGIPYHGITPLPVWQGKEPVKTIYGEVMKLSPHEVVILGADCMDGFYSPMISLTLLALHDLFSRTAGVRSRLTGFSFNSKPYRPLRRAFKNLTPSAAVNIRDAVSLKRFRKFTGINAGLVSDVAFLLEAESNFDGYDDLKEWCRARRACGTRYILGFNFHPMLRNYDNASGAEEDASAIARSLTAFMNKKNDIDLVLIPHDARSRYTDNIVLGTIAKTVSEAGLGNRTYYNPTVYNAAQIKAFCSLIDGVICSRMHLAIAALGQGKSVLAATYQGKFEGLFLHFGLPMKLLLSPSEFTGKGLVEHLENYTEHIADLNEKVEKELNRIIILSEKNLS